MKVFESHARLHDLDPILIEVKRGTMVQTTETVQRE
jgi:hypothetical protein